MCKPAVLDEERSIMLLVKCTVNMNLDLCPSWGLKEGISRYGQTANAVPKIARVDDTYHAHADQASPLL